MRKSKMSYLVPVTRTGRRAALAATGLLLPILLLSAVCSVASAEQDTLWRRTLSGTGNGDDIVSAMACDSSGNILAAICGVEGGPTIRTAKYSTQGQLLWTRRFAGPLGAVPAAIAVDNTGIVFVAGTCAQPGGTTDIVTISYSRNGDSLWVHFFDAGGVNDSATSLAMSPQGDAYVSGMSQVGGVWSSTLLKYSETGSLNWSRVRNVGDSLDDRVYASVFDPAGYIYQVGRGDWRAFAQQYTASGEFRWEQFYQGLPSRFRACVVDSRGNLVAAGGTEQPPGIGLLTVKFDRSGSQLWARSGIGGSAYTNVAIAVQTDGQDDVYVGGNFEQSYVIVKYDTGGTQLWFRRGSAAMQDSLCCLVFTPEGEAYASFIGDCPGSPSQQGVMVVEHAANGDSLWSSSWEPRARNVGVDVERTLLTATPTGVCIGSCYPWRRPEDDLASTVVRFRADGSQAWESEYNLTPGPTNDAANDVAFDREGNVIAVGRLEMTGEGFDLAVAKYSPTGELLWWKSWNSGEPGSRDEGFEVALDSADNVVVLGQSQSDTGLPRTMVVLKYSSDGALEWEQRFEGQGLGIRGVALAVDRFGYVAVSAVAMKDSFDYDYVTVKYDASGQRLWDRWYNGAAARSWDEPEAIAVDATGAVYVTGASEKAEGLRPATTIKYASDGSLCWVNDSFPTASGTYFSRGIHLDDDGSTRIAGYGYGSMFARSLFMARLDTAGHALWVGSSEDDSINWLRKAVLDARGRAVLSCSWKDHVGYVAMLDSTGARIWRRSVEGSDDCVDVAADESGVIYALSDRTPALVLRFWSALSVLDTLGRLRWSDSTGVDGLTVAARAPGLLVVGGRISGDMVLTLYSPHLGVEEDRPEEMRRPPTALNATPNPFSQNVRLLARNQSAGSAVRVYDCLGRCVRTWLDRSTSITSEWTWDGTDDKGSPLAAGVYVVRVEAVGSQWSVVRSSAAVRVIKLN
jgi:hypothetical protein